MSDQKNKGSGSNGSSRIAELEQEIERLKERYAKFEPQLLKEEQEGKQKVTMARRNAILNEDQDCEVLGSEVQHMKQNGWRVVA